MSKVHSFMKRALIGALAAALCLGALGIVGCSQQSASSSSAKTEAKSDTTIFTDSIGREVTVPANITKICPSGFTAQQVLLTMAPDKMVGLGKELNDYQLKIFGDKFKDAPVFGSILGAKDDLNREAIAKAAPDVIIDTGEAKKGIKEDLDALQEQIGIPVVFIEAKLSDFGSCYEKLGELLNMSDRGSKLSKYCKDAYSKVETTMNSIPEAERANIAYLLGDAGLNAIAKTSFQAQVVDLVANNVAVVNDPSAKGSGNEVSLEQIAVWNPAVILFQTGSIYDTVGSDAAWAGISAIQSGQYYEVPNDPWCWLNNPPTVNMMMGLQWLPRLLYPNKFDDSIEVVTKSYFETMYNYKLSDSELKDLLANALPKK